MVGEWLIYASTAILGDMQLTGNTILVTGGGSGIGAGLAGAFHRAGNQVVIAGRRRDALEAVANQYPGMTHLPLDLGNLACIDAFADELVRRHPDVNVLVNNAGIMAVEDLERSVPRVIRAVCSTNLIGPLLLVSRLLPTLKQHPRAAIVNVSSALAFVPKASMPTYSATKAALHSYTQSLRFQLQDSSIQVIEIPPPMVYTDNRPTDANGVGVDEFIDEVLYELASHPEAGEAVVSAARRLRFADRRGEYEKQFTAVNPMPQKGKS